MFSMGRALNGFEGERQGFNGIVRRWLAKENSEGAGRGLKCRGGREVREGRKRLLPVFSLGLPRIIF